MKSVRAIMTGLLIGLLCCLPGLRTVDGARTFDGTADYLEIGSAVVTAEPLTMACWFRPSGTAVASALLAIVKTGANPDRHTLTHNASGGQCRINSTEDGVITASAVSGTPSSGAWGHFAGVVSSSASRTAYYNGTAGTTDTTAITVTGVNRTLIGANYNGAYGGFANGDIAEAAVWNVALTADEIRALALGYSPRLIRRASLVLYIPAVKAAQDLRAGAVITDTGTADGTSHPPVRQ